MQFLTTFTQPTTRLKFFLRGWLLVLGLNEGLVECATVCVKSEVILMMAEVKLNITLSKNPEKNTQSRSNDDKFEYVTTYFCCIVHMY